MTGTGRVNLSHTHTHVSVTSAVRNVMMSEVSWYNSDGCRWSKNTPDRSTRGGSTQIAYFSKSTSTQCRNTLLHGSYNFIYHKKTECAENKRMVHFRLMYIIWYNYRCINKFITSLLQLVNEELIKLCYNLLSGFIHKNTSSFIR